MKKIQYILILGLLFVMAGCEKDTLPMNFSPALTTGGASDIFRVGATLSGSIQKSDGVVVKDCGILISELQSMAEYTEIKTSSTENTFNVLAQNLTPGKKYYYCAYASSGYSIARGDIKEFTTTDSNAPVFSELAISGKDEKSFTVETTILDEGGSDLILCGFCWRLSENGSAEPTVEDNVSNVSAQSSDISTRIKDLTPNKNYLVRAYGINGRGVGYGKTVTVSTNNATAPAVSSIHPTDSTSLSVSVKASILSAGESSISEIGFCWSAENKEPTTAHLKYNATDQLGQAAFNTKIADLKPETTYYIRAYAINGQGTGYGDTYTYTTGKGLEVTTLKVDVKGINIKAFGQVTPGTQNYHHGFEVATNKDELLNGGDNVIREDIHTNMSYNEANGTFNGDIANLKVNTTYYIRAWFMDSTTQDIIYGNVLDFKTEDVPGIYSLKDLLEFRDAKKAGTDMSKWKDEQGVFNLYADIDISTIKNWEPINGIAANEVFEGNGHTISGLNITEIKESKDHYGFILFNDGAIHKLHLGTGYVEITAVTDGWILFGSMCGINRGIISDCSSKVTVKDSRKSGNIDSQLHISGICGASVMSGSIVRCINRGDVTGGWHAAGIVGDNSGVVEACENYGKISALDFNQSVMGISGCWMDARVFNCKNYGTINGGTANYVGGITAGLYGEVQNSVNEGTVTGGGNSVGGIAGDVYQNGVLRNCRNLGNIAGTNNAYAGGIGGHLTNKCTFEGNLNGGTVNGAAGVEANAIGKDDRGAGVNKPGIDDLPNHEWK